MSSPAMPAPAQPAEHVPPTQPTGQPVTIAEIESQPAMWARALADVEAQRRLPAAGVPVLFAGCGTSYYVGDSYARARSEAGVGHTRAAIASEVDEVGADDLVVVLSRSGTTSDVLRLAERLRGTHRLLGLVGTADSPLVDLCDEVLLLDWADEESVMQTRFPTTVLTLLRASLGEDLRGLVAAGDTALRAPLPEPLPQHLVFLGTAWTVGLANEAALKCREAAGAWTEAYPIREYEHGPIAAAGPGSLVWSLTRLPDTTRSAVVATGARVVEPDLDAQAQVVVAQRLAVALARAAGRDPDRPDFLSRSVQYD